MKTEGMMHFVVEKEERKYVFVAPLGAPFGETHDALHEVLAEVLSMAQKRAEDAQERLKKEEEDKDSA